MTLEKLFKKPKIRYVFRENGVEVIFKDLSTLLITDYDYWRLRQLELKEVWPAEEEWKKHGSNLEN